jgi:hypothetical protein
MYESPLKVFLIYNLCFCLDPNLTPSPSGVSCWFAAYKLRIYPWKKPEHGLAHAPYRASYEGSVVTTARLEVYKD